MGNITCTAANEAVPGTYVNFVTNGEVTGSTYTMTGAGFNGYQMFSYGPPGSTPAPTTPPLTPATPTPSMTPGALGTLYYGEYTLPGFIDVAHATTVDATDGCFQFETVQALGGTIGQARPADASPPPSASGYGVGNPAFAPPYPNEIGCVNDNGACAYAFTSFVINNLTRTTGTGTFTLTPNGTTSTVTGTVTVTGSTTYPTEPIEDGSHQRLPQVRRR